ncbi:MAG: ABC transporter permease [Acidimicrobiia bacterium]
MFKLTLKELAARKLRLFTTAVAVVIGVAFMAGTSIFTDTVGATFDSALADANRGVDAYIRTPSAIEIGYGQSGPLLDASLASTVAAVDGVDRVALRINGYAQLVDRSGKPIGDPNKSPAFGTNWVSVDDLNPYELAAGRTPSNDDEIVIDKASADKAGYRPGDVATVLTKRDPRQFTVAGIARFGDNDSPAGATAVLFTDAAAAELLGTIGKADGIAVTAEPGRSQSELASRVQAAVGNDVEVITGERLIEQDQAQLRSVFAGFNTMLLMFALVAVFVGAFIINNTFSIIVAQRTREMAMLRAIGASGRQVKRSVLIEAAAIGVVASATGLIVGIGVAVGLRSLMTAFGFTLPDGPMRIVPSSMALSFGVGLLVSVVSAWLPARRAARIAPIAALRETNVDRSAASRQRAGIGLVVTGGGVTAMLAGVAAEALAIVAVGAVAIFVGVSVLGPVLVRPITAMLTLPLRSRGVSGELAARNAARNPKRTARTASSLMIGVGLVGFIMVFATSVKSSVAGSLATEFTGTHIVDSGSYDSTAGLSPDLAAALRMSTEVEVVSEARLANVRINGRSEVLNAFNASTIGELFTLGDVSGNLDAMGADGVAISAEHARNEHLALGSALPITFPTGDATMVVKAIYSAGTDWVGPQFVDLAAFDDNEQPAIDSKIYVTGDESAIEAAAASYPTAQVLDRAAFLHAVNSDIDTVLGLFYALLGLAVLIALLGIANTLALSTFERTRELGLLRAVGMSRSQVRSAIRWESIIMALFGSALGLVVGVFFGWVTVRAMSDQGIDTLSIPVTGLITVSAIAAVAGAVAAVLPARRAARLTVLRAMATA